MKQLQVLLALFAFAFLPLHAASLADLTYATTDGKISIIDCDGAAKGKLVIPDTIEGKPVTSIGDEAFRDCTSLTSITIPDSVTSIEKYAFLDCTNLTTITVGASNVAYMDVNGVLFNKEKTVLLNHPAGKTGANYTIPDGVTSIRKTAFQSCTSLTSITIPDGVTSIGESAFRDCTSLTSITIPDGVTSIGESAFRDCTSLTSITIPDGIQEIENNTFYQCFALSSVTLPDGLTRIGSGAFIHCKIPDFVIPASVTSIEGYAFRNSHLKKLNLPVGVTVINDTTFGDCVELGEVNLHGGVTRLENFAFVKCPKLTSIQLPTGLTHIGDNAFSRCSSLRSITFLGTAPTVDANTFKDVADDAIAFVTPKALKSFGEVGDKWNGLTLKIGSASIATDPKKVAAGHSDEKELILLSSHLNTVEVDFPVLLKKREDWKISRISAQLKIDTAYLTSLKKLKTSMVQKGEIAAARAIDQAIKGGTRTDDEPAILTKSRQVRYDALLAAMKPIDQQYWKELKKLKEDVQSQGDLERFEIVLSEITRVLAPYK